MVAAAKSTAAPDAAKLGVVSKKAADGALHKRLELTEAHLREAHARMLLARRFEEKAAALYQQGEIRGFLHLGIGQEAVTTAAKMASADGDDFITSYRCHNLALECGIPGEAIMAELTGRSTGISQGKGGSMHMFDPDLRFWGGHGIVAAQVPIGAGLAFASKYRGENRVSFTFMGDGAVNAGQVFEAFNMAALWALPVVFVIENNRYGMGTSVPRAAAGDLYKRGEPFGMPCEKVDGMDFFAVYEAMRRAGDHCRKGLGPYLLELDTYRYRGHSMSDPGKYRTRDEVDCVREQRDPIIRMQKYLMDNFKIGADVFESLDNDVQEKVARMAEAAVSAPWPDTAVLFTDIMPE